MRTSNALLLPLVLIIAAAGCGGGDGGTAPIRVGSVTVTPAAPSVAQGATVQLDAAVKDQNGAALTGRAVSWASGNTTIATVSGAGLVTGVSAGSTSITATSEGISGSTTVTVTPPPVAAVSITPNAPTVASGETTTLTATLRDNGGVALTGRTVTWATSAATIATVTATGATATVTGVAAGTAQITATSEGKSAQVAVTVTVATFAPTANGTLGGTRSYASINIPAGVTITVTSALTLNVTGSVTIAGTLTGECLPVSIVADGALTVRGAIANGCATLPDGAPPTLSLVGKGGYEMDDADIESAGDVTITNNPALSETNFATLTSARMARRVSNAQASGLGAAAETRCTYRAASNKRYRARPPKAKNGADGVKVGQPGRDGSVFRLMCDGDMLFTGSVVVQAQHGGDGGKAEDPSNTAASATGGAGGVAGNIRILGTGDVTFTGGVNRLQSGDGGKGGDAIAIGQPNDAALPKATSATATGGKGGDTSKGSGRDGPLWVRGGSITVNPTGLSPNALTMAIGTGGNGGKAEATGANGRDAAGENSAQNGGDATSKGGAGGKSLDLQLRANGATLGSSDVKVEGGSAGFGGAANGTAGNGGAPSDTRKKGGDGGNLAVDGGVGGDASLRNLSGTLIGLWGNGGPVQFTGGNGNDGYDECRPRLIEGGLAGKGGTATGGDGAPGAVGLARPAPGGNTILVNGIGNGAEGGDGWGPAIRGGAGTDNIRAPVGGGRLNTAQNFDPGLPGALCPKAEQFLAWVGRVINDPAGHNPFVNWLNIPGVNFRAIDGLLRFAGVAPMVTIQGAWDATLKKFVVTGSGTVAGRPNTPIRAECTPGANGTLVCVITIGGTGAIAPLTTPIVYEFTLTVPPAT